jgi:prophage regulatory protein
MTDIKFLNIKQVKEITSISTASIYRLMANNEFPHSISIFSRRVAWVESEVKAWVMSKALSAKLKVVNGTQVWEVEEAECE